MREVEEEIIAKVRRISKHLTQSINEGMEEYRTFIIDGIMLIEPYGDDVPLEVTEKFFKFTKTYGIIRNRELLWRIPSGQH